MESKADTEEVSVHEKVKSADKEGEEISSEIEGVVPEEEFLEWLEEVEKVDTERKAD